MRLNFKPNLALKKFKVSMTEEIVLVLASPKRIMSSAKNKFEVKVEVLSM